MKKMGSVMTKTLCDKRRIRRKVHGVTWPHKENVFIVLINDKTVFN